MYELSIIGITKFLKIFLAVIFRNHINSLSNLSRNWFSLECKSNDIIGTQIIYLNKILKCYSS